MIRLSRIIETVYVVIRLLAFTLCFVSCWTGRRRQEDRRAARTAAQSAADRRSRSPARPYRRPFSSVADRRPVPPYHAHRSALDHGNLNGLHATYHQHAARRRRWMPSARRLRSAAAAAADAAAAAAAVSRWMWRQLTGAKSIGQPASRQPKGFCRPAVARPGTDAEICVGTCRYGRVGGTGRTLRYLILSRRYGDDGAGDFSFYYI